MLAEEAVQLFRDSDYTDLITFEEDVARIAAVVLVIAESPGSLAELGAFASNATISKVLRVVIQDEHEKAESFVRYGPLRRVSNARRGNLGVYPWKMKDGRLVVASAKPHYSQIKRFIGENIDAIPLSTQFTALAESKLFYVIYWIIYICQAISPVRLLSYVNLIDPSVTTSELNRKLYCLILAKWIGREAYSDKDYYFACNDVDVFDYAFRAGAKETKAVRWKLAVYRAHNRFEKIPSHVRKVATAARRAKAR